LKKQKRRHGNSPRQYAREIGEGRYLEIKRKGREREKNKTR
jgi:hypothetical protein